MKLIPPRKTRRIHHRDSQAKRRLELLESRILLAADPVLEFPSLDVSSEIHDPSSVLVRFQPGSRPSGINVTEGTETGETELLPGLWKMDLPDGSDVVEALDSLGFYPGLVYAEPNYQVSVTAQPNDPEYDSLWGLENQGQTGGTAGADIRAEDAWEITTGNSNTIVAVVDTGVDYLHPDLAANMWTNPGEIAGDGIDNDGNGYVDDIHGYDFANRDGDPMDDHFHGTHVAGTIGAVADNGIGVAGVSWDVQIMAVKFLTSRGSGSISAAISAIEYAVDNGATVSNHSWGFNGAYSQALADAIEYARIADHVVVAAAGNGGSDGIGDNNEAIPFFPGNFEHENLLAVAATDHNDQLATFSNYGSTMVDLGAPGVGIYSTMPNNQYDTLNGTSMATPHVTGVVALLQSEHPDWPYEQIRDRIFDTVDAIPALDSITSTGGRLNAAAAVTPDLTGPAVLESFPDGDSMKEISRIRVTFDEKIKVSTFTIDDVVAMEGPLGSIAVDSVDVVPGSYSRQFDISFAEQAELGLYTLTIGPDILDMSDNPMDQNGDGIAGQSTADQFTASVTIIPDTVGPFVVATNPSGGINASLDRVEVTFDEKILDGTFTVDDILNMTGPGGDIQVVAVTPVTSSLYEIVFPNQDTLGHYSIEIGSQITDRAGNLLDQDRDGIGGESEDDVNRIEFDLESWLYADRVIDFSSQFSASEWSAEQALGPPDTFAYGDIVTAWAPSVANGSEEFLTVGFETPLLASGVSIRETFGNGFVTRIELRNELTGEYTTVSTETDPSPKDVAFDYLATWPLTNYPVDAVRITVDTDHDLNAYEEIDSVQLRGVTVPDTDGARIIDSTLQGSVNGAVDRFELTFDEAVRDGSFTLDDITDFLGPEGAIIPTSVNRLSGSRYEVVFPAQDQFGDYSLSIGPDILDLDDLPMNQDRDDLNGETDQDQFDVSFRIELWQFAESVVDFSSQYSATSWSASQALGPSDTLDFGDSRDAWSPSSSNGTTESLTVAFATPMIASSVVIRETYGNGFVTQVEARDAETGAFTVVFTGPDTSETGIPFDNLISWDPLPSPVDAVRIAVDTNHATTYEQIDSVQLRGVIAPDTRGPKVISSWPDTGHSGSLDHVTLAFDEPINAATFTLDDIISIDGPSTDIIPTGIQVISETEFQIDFATQVDFGTYHFVLGSQIEDLAGNLMDQNGDGTGGTTADHFDLTFEVEFWQYASSVIDFSSQYSSTSWSAADTLGPSDTFVYGDQRTAWAPKNTNGTTEFVTVGFETPVLSTGVVIRETYGNGFVRNVELRNAETGVFNGMPIGVDDSLPGTPVDFTVSWPITDYSVDAVRVTIDTSQTSTSEEIDSIQLRGVVAPDTTGPRVIASTPQDGAAGPIDQIDLVFSEPIDPLSFTAEDVLQLEGPDGAIAVNAVETLAADQYRIKFDSQTTFGSYSLLLGSDVKDLAGNPIDQNVDGIAGGVGDEFDLTFDLELWQFASNVIDFSSQYSATSWSAAQALGPSDTFTYGDSRDAWAPKVTNGSTEFLTVGFDTPVLSTGVIIRETFGNGFVRQVEVRDADTGVFHQIPIGSDDSEVGTPVDYSISWPITSYAVDAVRITIDTSQTYSSEEIDSVILRGVVAPDLTGPNVVASVPQDGSSGPISQIDLTFSEPIDPTTFTSVDILQFSGPAGEIAVTSVEAIADDHYRIAFATQDTFGSYTLSVGSDISDLAGNLLDQNGDGDGGNVDDHFTLNFEVELWQYASTVVDYSSQYSWPSWSASQALGPSDTLVYGDKRTAWAPKSTNGTTESLTVGFETPVFATGAVIRETYGNGFVRQVELRDALTGVFHVMPIGTDDSQQGTPVDFSLSWAETSYAVDAIRITVDTNHSTRSEEIDSVQLRGRGAG